MADSVRILLGVATVTPDKRFLQSLAPFADSVARNLPHVNIDYVNGWVWGETLETAQNIMADKVLDGNYDYLLTIEDDHWDFTWQMLETCLNSDAHASGIPYRSRHFPFDVVPMIEADIRKDGTRLFKGMNDADKYTGYHECDLLGFGFTLIKSETFRIIDRPFFKENIKKYPGAGPRATDILFTEALQSKGLKCVGCFQHRLKHRDIEEANHKKMLVEGILCKSSLFSTLENVSKFDEVKKMFEKAKKENRKLL